MKKKFFINLSPQDQLNHQDDFVWKKKLFTFYKLTQLLSN